MRFIILAALVCVFASVATADVPKPAPWVSKCPSLETSKPVCAMREDTNTVFGKATYYLTFLSTCFLEQYNLANSWYAYTPIAPAGKTCDDLGKIEPYILRKPFE